jgi:hypothetical protein
MANGIVLFFTMAVAALITATIARAVRATVITAKGIAPRLEPVLAALREGRTPSVDQIQVLAADETTRVPLYRALQSAGRGELFPPEYATAEALADEDS